MKNFAFCVVIIITLFGSKVWGVTIDFEQFTNDFFAGGELVGDEFVNDGVLFSTLDAELNIGLTGFGGSFPNALGANLVLGGNDGDGSLAIDFLSNKVSTDLSFVAASSSAIGIPFVEAVVFDISGQVLVTRSTNLLFDTFSFAGLEVSRVEISGIQPTIDDVMFTLSDPTNPGVSIPEPSTHLLFATGILGLVWYRWKSAMKQA